MLNQIYTPLNNLINLYYKYVGHQVYVPISALSRLYETSGPCGVQQYSLFTGTL